MIPGFVVGVQNRGSALNLTKATIMQLSQTGISKALRA